jgi:outer membrane protein TolC
MRPFFFALSTSLALQSSFCLAATLTLEEYLLQLETKNESFKSANLASQSAGLREGESGLAQAWSLNAGVEQRNDFRLPIGVAFQTRTTNYLVGVSKLTSFGLMGKLNFTVTPISFENVPAAFSSFLPFTSYFDTAATIELTQSLWKNGFGRATRAQESAEQAITKASKHRSSYITRQIRAQAETAYWIASSYQEIVRIQRENKERAQKLVEWSKGRVQLDLADKADLLQAESVFRVREMELAQSLGDSKTASRNFNSLRGIDSEEISEKLQRVFIEKAEEVAPPERAEYRDDVRASMEEANAAYWNARLGSERNKPTFEVYVSHTLSGRDAALSNALNAIKQANYTLSVFGVRFITPLEFGTLSDNNEAYVRDSQAAELTRSRKTFEQESDWKDLTRRMGESKEKLELARQLEKAQEEKFRYEQLRLKNARSTLFQVLQFEQDYASAQLNRIQKETELRSVLTQMKLFGSKS